MRVPAKVAMSILSGALLAGCIAAATTKARIYNWRGGEFMIVATDAIDKDVLQLDNSLYLEDVDQWVVFIQWDDGSWRAYGSDALAGDVRNEGRLLRTIDYRRIARVERGRLVLPKPTPQNPDR
jgi:hypothetical protein